MEKIKGNEAGRIEILYDRKKIRALLRTEIYSIVKELIVYFMLTFGILTAVDLGPKLVMLPAIGLFLFCSVLLIAIAVPGLYKYWQIRVLCETGEPAIVLNDNGISFYEGGIFSGISESFVYWDDIAYLPTQIMEKWIPIFVKNPKAYTDKKSILKRMTQCMNMKLCGSPVVITHTYFTLSNEMLCELIRETLQRRLSR